MHKHVNLTGDSKGYKIVISISLRSCCCNVCLYHITHTTVAAEQLSVLRVGLHVTAETATTICGIFVFINPATKSIRVS